MHHSSSSSPTTLYTGSQSSTQHTSNRPGIPQTEPNFKFTVGNLPNFFNKTGGEGGAVEAIRAYHPYELSRVAYPMALALQALGNVLVLKIYRHKKTDSMRFIANYIASDLFFLFYVIVAFSFETTIQTCPYIQVFYTISITLPVYAVLLVTLKRFVRICLPLKCTMVLSWGRELVLVLGSWCLVIGVSSLSLAGWCPMELESRYNYCHYTLNKLCYTYLFILFMLNFCFPLISVIVMYSLILKESRKAFKKQGILYIDTKRNICNRLKIIEKFDIPQRPPTPPLVIPPPHTNLILTNPTIPSLSKHALLEKAHSLSDIIFVNKNMAPIPNMAPPPLTDTSPEVILPTGPDILDKKEDSGLRNAQLHSLPNILSPNKGPSRDFYNSEVPNKDQMAKNLRSMISTPEQLVIRKNLVFKAKRLSQSSQMSVFGTVWIIVLCFVIRTIPWAPQIVAPDQLYQTEYGIQIADWLNVVQCLGIASCPYVFLLTTRKLKRSLSSMINQILTLWSSRKNKTGRVSPSPSTSSTPPASRKEFGEA